jgi:hypothetical protein
VYLPLRLQILERRNMKAEEFFTSIALSYKALLTTSGSDVPCFRDYCRSRHVSYTDFMRWASFNEVASGILEIERSKKRLEKEKAVKGALSSVKSDVSDKTLLYPLHIIPDSCDNRIAPVVTPSSLRGIYITFPNGVKISVGEADSRGIYSLVHGKEL